MFNSLKKFLRILGPVIFIIALIVRNVTIMGQYKSGWLSNLLLWLTFLGMGTAAVGMLATFVHV